MSNKPGTGGGHTESHVMQRVTLTRDQAITFARRYCVRPEIVALTDDELWELMQETERRWLQR